jgi:ferredoxin--NADP+ reductase
MADEGSDYDLIVIGGTAGGLSVAISSLRSGLTKVRVIEPGASIAFPELAPENQVEIGYGEQLISIDADEDSIIVVTDQRTYRTRGCLVAIRHRDPDWTPPMAATLSENVTIDALPEWMNDRDILVVGHTNHAAELVAKAAAAGAGVVFAAGGMDPGLLAPAADAVLRRLERERRVTVLYRSIPDEIGHSGEFPIAFFNDRRTPDLEFDHIVFASARTRPTVAELGITQAAIDSGKLWFDGAPEDGVDVPNGHSWEVGNMLAAACFPELELTETPSVVHRRVRHESAIDELREESYNATITAFDQRHSDLWVLRVRPDHGDTSHLPGQYASLGLGYWEDRVDNFADPDIDDKWIKLIRRSYSISHSMFEGSGYLAPPDTEELEFYIVLVPADEDHVSALTPRLAQKQVGDRIYLGPKVAGRYTLNAVEDPEAAVVFFATGTGEAPHNSMVTELLRKGHTGPIISTVTVRNWQDLGYLEAHRRLEERFQNYHYLPMPTREADVPKRYLQDLIRDGDIELLLGGTIDPSNTHAFLCGNPAMIGLPEEEDGVPVFPETTGVIELLVERGFTIDRRNEPGNIHFEEYW